MASFNQNKKRRFSKRLSEKRTNLNLLNDDSIILEEDKWAKSNPQWWMKLSDKSVHTSITNRVKGKNVLSDNSEFDSAVLNTSALLNYLPEEDLPNFNEKLGNVRRISSVEDINLTSPVKRRFQKPSNRTEKNRFVDITLNGSAQVNQQVAETSLNISHLSEEPENGKETMRRLNLKSQKTKHIRKHRFSSAFKADKDDSQTENMKKNCTSSDDTDEVNKTETHFLKQALLSKSRSHELDEFSKLLNTPNAKRKNIFGANTKNKKNYSEAFDAMLSETESTNDEANIEKQSSVCYDNLNSNIITHSESQMSGGDEQKLMLSNKRIKKKFNSISEVTSRAEESLSKEISSHVNDVDKSVTNKADRDRHVKQRLIFYEHDRDKRIISEANSELVNDNASMRDQVSNLTGANESQKNISRQSSSRKCKVGNLTGAMGLSHNSQFKSINEELPNDEKRKKIFSKVKGKRNFSEAFLTDNTNVVNETMNQDSHKIIPRVSETQNCLQTDESEEEFIEMIGTNHSLLNHDQSNSEIISRVSEIKNFIQTDESEEFIEMCEVNKNVSVNQYQSYVERVKPAEFHNNIDVPQENPSLQNDPNKILQNEIEFIRDGNVDMTKNIGISKDSPYKTTNIINLRKSIQKIPDPVSNIDDSPKSVEQNHNRVTRSTMFSSISSPENIEERMPLFKLKKYISKSDDSETTKKTETVKSVEGLENSFVESIKWKDANLFTSTKLNFETPFKRKKSIQASSLKKSANKISSNLLHHTKKDIESQADLIPETLIKSKSNSNSTQLNKISIRSLIATNLQNSVRISGLDQINEPGIEEILLTPSVSGDSKLSSVRSKRSEMYENRSTRKRLLEIKNKNVEMRKPTPTKELIQIEQTPTKFSTPSKQIDAAQKEKNTPIISGSSKVSKGSKKLNKNNRSLKHQNVEEETQREEQKTSRESMKVSRSNRFVESVIKEMLLTPNTNNKKLSQRNLSNDLSELNNTNGKKQTRKNKSEYTGNEEMVMNEVENVDMEINKDENEIMLGLKQKSVCDISEENTLNVKNVENVLSKEDDDLKVTNLSEETRIKSQTSIKNDKSKTFHGSSTHSAKILTPVIRLKRFTDVSHHTKHTRSDLLSMSEAVILTSSSISKDNFRENVKDLSVSKPTGNLFTFLQKTNQVDKKSPTKALLKKVLNSENTPEVLMPKVNTISNYFPVIDAKRLKWALEKPKKPTEHVVNVIKLIDGKEYKPKKLAKPQKWVTPRLYNFLQKKLEKSGPLKKVRRSEELAAMIVETVLDVVKSKKPETKRTRKLAQTLANANVIETMLDFYEFVENFLPFNFREKVIPCRQAHSLETNVPFEPENLDKPLKERNSLQCEQ